jgi:hypothetical protein
LLNWPHVARLAVFDELLGNDDRHLGNLVQQIQARWSACRSSARTCSAHQSRLPVAIRVRRLRHT